MHARRKKHRLAALQCEADVPLQINPFKSFEPTRKRARAPLRWK
jgi:hypothetical protein